MVSTFSKVLLYKLRQKGHYLTLSIEVGYAMSPFLTATASSPTKKGAFIKVSWDETKKNAGVLVDLILLSVCRLWAAVD